MQNTGRIYAAFRSKEKWDFFLDNMVLSAGDTKASLREILGLAGDHDWGFRFKFFGNGAFAYDGVMAFSLSDFWDENSLKNLFSIFHKYIGEDAIIIGDTLNYSCYPMVSYEYYSLGGEMREYIRGRGAEKHFDIEISDVDKWLGATRKKELTADETAFLKEVQALNKIEEISDDEYDDEDYSDEDYYDEDYYDEDIE